MTPRRRFPPRAPSAAVGRACSHRGAALAEAVVAAAVLTVGVLGVAGALAGGTRDVTRGRTTAAAAELVAERVVAWRGAPCTAGAGERVVGAWRERWHVAVADGLAVLADTVVPAQGMPSPRVGAVAVAGCAP